MNSNSSTDSSLSSSNSASADAISRRAYELWEQEGRPDGNDLRHWLQAEQELGERGGSGAAASSSSATRNSSDAQSARQQATDTRPLQGTRAAAAANRGPKRASQSPFGSDSSSSLGNSKTEVAARRRM
ncbi:MAG TPA: DUF2934 domain-containing protein [Opitutaceae bacterium]|nr:DUF2934 domain-containing protein [Opitutaceae bacterium]